MKPLRLNVATLALWSVLMLLAGCTHKKPVLVAPQPLPPAAAPEASPTPEPAQPADKSQAQQDAQAESPDQTKPETTQADKSKPPQKPSPRKRKTVIDADKTQPAPAAGQVSPAPTTADASHAQGSTEQLLKSAEANLNGITRPLSKDEEAKRSQARAFIEQSRKATTENDSTRAYNLSVKARLLSDELVQQR